MLIFQVGIVLAYFTQSLPIIFTFSGLIFLAISTLMSAQVKFRNEEQEEKNGKAKKKGSGGHI